MEDLNSDTGLRSKINFRFIMVSFVTILVTIVLSTMVFYELFRKEIIDDLKTYTHVLKNTGVFDASSADEGIGFSGEELRITVVADNGDVLYDNMVNPSTMGNHDNRPEIAEAEKTGEGYDVRMSETLKESTFYYAVKLKNGNILRVAKDSSSIWSIFASGLPILIIMVIMLGVVVYIITHFLTKSILRPIEEMSKNLEASNDIKCYKEMRPFIDTIKNQHEDIVKNAQIRQEFTANVSHELKTPLTSISGYSELIENGMATDKDITKFAGEIHRNSNRLLTLINDIIKLSELDVSEQSTSMKRLNLFEIAQSSVDMLQVSAENHNVSLTLYGEPSYIMADKMMMEELVYNLVDNAIRYNYKDGSVYVKVYKANDKVVLKVKDTGIGIPKEHQTRIFERFYRIDKSRSKKTGGTGLGLAIVKHIVAQNDAEISVESEPGKGTEISVTFNRLSNKE